MNVYYEFVADRGGLYLPVDAKFRYVVYNSIPAYLFKNSGCSFWHTHITNGHVTKTGDGWIYGSEWMLKWDTQDLQRPVPGECGYWLDAQTGTRVTAHPIDWDYLKLKSIFL